jgi:hypothetical protein
MALRATKGDEDPDAGARFGLSWSCAVAGLGVFAVSSSCLQPSGVPRAQNSPYSRHVVPGLFCSDLQNINRVGRDRLGKVSA